jgi:hypothetical protein
VRNRRGVGIADAVARTVAPELANIGVKSLAAALILWTAVVLAGIILFVPGQVPPCPEAVPVGLSEVQRVEVLRMCADRAQLGPGPLIGLPIWIIGAGVVVGAALRFRKNHDRVV